VSVEWERWCGQGRGSLGACGGGRVGRPSLSRSEDTLRSSPSRFTLRFPRSSPSASTSPLTNHVGAFFFNVERVLRRFPHPFHVAPLASGAGGRAARGGRGEREQKRRRRSSAPAKPRRHAEGRPSRPPISSQAARLSVCASIALRRKSRRGVPWSLGRALRRSRSAAAGATRSHAPSILLTSTGRQDRQPDARHPGRQAGPQHLRRRIR